MLRGHWYLFAAFFFVIATTGARTEDKIVAHWSFESSEGNIYFDETENGHDVTVTGTGVSVGPGVKGNALLCSGSSYSTEVANSRDTMNRMRFSIEAWVYLNIPPSQINEGANIFNFQYPSSISITGYSVHVDDWGKVAFSMSNASGSSWIVLTSTTLLQQNKWYHVVCTYDSSMMRVYVNGIPDGSLSVQGGYPPPGINAHIGCVPQTVGTYYARMDGKIDELAYYNYPLSPDTIRAHYNKLKPINTEIAIAHWSFDSVDENTYFDVTGNGHDATVTGTGVSVGSGVKGDALVCTEDAFSTEVANSRDAMNLRRFSIESWVNLSVPPSQVDVGGNIFNFQNGITSGVRNGYSVHICQDGRVDFSMSSSTGDDWMECVSTAAVLQSKWYHIVCTYDSIMMRVYVNGNLEGSLQYEGSYLPPGSNAHIGCVPLSGGGFYARMAGKIDELAFYNYPLSPDTIRAHYNKLKLTDPVDTAMTVAHWSFDSTYGLTFYDNTGHGYTAIGSGDSIRITDGLKGKALECRGPKDNSVFSTYDIQVPTSVGAFNVKNFTIEGWIYSYVDLVNPGSFYNAREIFDYATVGMEGSGTAGGFMVGCWNDGKFYFSMSNPGGWNFLSSDSIVKPNRWYHFAALYNGADMRVYLNGRLAAQQANSSGYVLPSNAARIGCQYQLTGASTGRTRVFFNGKIDELKLYNYALDTQAVKAHYNELKPSDERPFKINFGMKITYAKPGDTIWVPIYITNYENYAFCATQFTLRINPEQLTLLTISNDSGLVKNWMLDWNRTQADSIPVGVAGTTDTIKYGEGEFLRCKFLVKPTVQDGDTCLIKMENIEIDENFHLIDAMNVPGKVIIRNPVINYGDVTGDGKVTVFDARDILSYVVGMITLPDAVNHPHFTIVVADVTGNNIVSSYDAALVFQYSLGMLSDFPVMRQARLCKWAATPYHADEANLSIALASQSSTDGMKFNVTGDNLNGFIAGELAIKYDAGVANIDKGSVGTSLRGATLQSKIDESNRLIKIAMTTNDDITVSDPMVLATITLPPNSTSSPSQAFTIEAAYLNEGKIQTNVVNGGIVGIGRSNKPGMKAVQNPVVFRNNKLYVSFGMMPVTVQVYTLGGRNIHTQIAGAAGNAVHCIDLGHLPSAAFLYRIVNNNSVIHSGKVMINR